MLVVPCHDTQRRDLTCRNISFSFCVIPHYSTCECVEAAVGSAECPRWPTPPCKTTDPHPPSIPPYIRREGPFFFSPFPSDAQSSYIIVFIPMWGERGEGGRRAGPFFFFFRPASFLGETKGGSGEETHYADNGIDARAAFGGEKEKDGWGAEGEITMRGGV